MAFLGLLPMKDSTPVPPLKGLTNKAKEIVDSANTPTENDFKNDHEPFPAYEQFVRLSSGMKIIVGGAAVIVILYFFRGRRLY